MVEDGLRRDELTRFRLLHQPGGEVDGVAHDRERPASGGAEIAHEHGAGVHADAQVEVGYFIEHVTGRAQHALFVVAE